jgi:hypothetical protein
VWVAEIKDWHFDELWDFILGDKHQREDQRYILKKLLSKF